MNEISLHILDIVQNSIAAGARHIIVDVAEDCEEDRLAVTVTDDGCGMDGKTAEQAQSPFTTTRTTRKVGLGIPMFKQSCLGCCGEFALTSQQGAGTTVCGSYRLSHIDRPPLGSLADTICLLVLANPELDFRFRHDRDGKEYALDTAELRQVLGDVPLTEPGVSQWIRQYLDESEHNLYGGVLDR